MTMFGKMIKKLKGGKDLTKERNERCFPIANEVLAAIGNFEGKIYAEGEYMKKVEAYAPLTEEILTILLNSNTRSGEVDYILRLIKEPIEIVSDMVVTSLNKSIDKATDIVWGMPSEEITLKDIDKKLIGQAMK